MDFALDERAETFRAEVQAFLREHLTDAVRARVAASGTYHDWEFHRAVARQGWIGAGWPVEDGGQGRDRADLDILYEELAAAGAPVEGMSVTLIIAETVRRVGTPEQKERILGPVREGRLLLSLGYTEPDAGSDLASARTRAVRDGDTWRIDGQKNFTTHAHEADYVFLLARTDPQAPKHAGLTMFLVPTSAEGFSLTPVHTLSGERTNLTFYSGVHVGDDARIGDVGQGWPIVSLALAFERGGEFAAQLRRLVHATVAWAHAARRTGDTRLLRRLGRVAAATDVARLLGSQATWLRSSAQAGAVEGAMAKVYGTEALLAGTGALLDAAGPDGLLAGPGEPAAELQHLYREAQISTLYGGTSEVLRGVIAERRLGLPRSRRG
ncbi:acyl-CoA dehydrogenase family protein [Dactylosporangium sp. AC04546]|uniref:acyl-CoA dehydrogenase family protein n=1 Tax=Dactylosporangium sp. AC04546 TaxID=2862460 RepID=UPI001EE06F1A|nr:acyl-CoA dehydrogenase family protein [Dactylosporangium sp. AC04546]WVK87277.1 acyl-CoA dehydrogenase family protein [Dactylosporangium sp. AC04546]